MSVVVEEIVINEIVPREDTVKKELKALLSKHFTGNKKPLGFDSVEIRIVGENRYRVNVICRHHRKEDLFDTLSRPFSYYVIDNNGNYEFSPELN